MDNNIKIYHYNREDPLLKEENIEDYMNKCLEPFLLPNKNKFNPKEIISKNIVINPFGSESNKNIPEDLTFRIIKDFRARYPTSKILIIAGFRNSFIHLMWCAKLKAKLSEENLLAEIIFKNYGSFSEIKNDLEKYKISLGITADTSITHLFNWLGIRNLTIYNLERCDLNSSQSLASDSPLGFCRFGVTQFPALLYEGNNNLASGIIGFIEYFLSDKRDLSWAKKVFNDKILISEIKNKYSDLLRANNQINPLNKIKQNDKIC